MQEPFFFYTSKSATIPDLTKQVSRHINYYMYFVRRDKSQVFAKIRLWKSNSTDWLEIKNIDSKYANFTQAKVNATPINVSELSQKLIVDDIDFVDEDIFIAETPKKGEWVLQPQKADGDQDEDDSDAENQEEEKK